MQRAGSTYTVVSPHCIRDGKACSQQSAMQGPGHRLHAASGVAAVLPVVNLRCMRQGCSSWPASHQARLSAAADLAVTARWLVTNLACTLLRAPSCARQQIQDDRAGATCCCKPSSQGTSAETLAAICCSQLLHTPGSLRNSRGLTRVPTDWGAVAISPLLCWLRRPGSRGWRC